MLRSIIAIWSVALALLVIAATAGCQLGGCANGDDCSVVTPSTPPPSPPDMAQPVIACAQRCGTCATGEFCFQPSGQAQLPAFCARACADDRDCGSNEKCAQLFAALQPAVCITATMPVGCAPPTPGWHCDFPGPTCADANTLLVPFSDASRRVCGSERVHCANGCRNGGCL